MPFTVTLADGQKHTVQKIKDLETLIRTGKVTEDTMIFDEDTKTMHRAGNNIFLDQAFLKYRPSASASSATQPSSTGAQTWIGES